MDNADNVDLLAQTEPWRTGQGRPRNMMDPLWATDTLVLCDAGIEDLQWDVMGTWWWCRRCGHCSNLHHLTHFVVESPERYYELSLEHFFQRRDTQGMKSAEIHDQAHYIAGIALRVAASKRPEEFARLADAILALAN